MPAAEMYKSYCAEGIPAYSRNLVKNTLEKIQSEDGYQEKFDKAEATLSEKETAAANALGKLSASKGSDPALQKDYYEVVSYVCNVLLPARKKLIPRSILAE